MVLLWTPIAMAFGICSALASCIQVIHFWRHMNLWVSSLCYALFAFFVALFLWTLFRSIYFVWLTTLPFADLVDLYQELTPKQLDRLGVHASVRLQTIRSNGWITASLIAGDASLLAVALWMFPLTYEVLVVTKKSMDRGAKAERMWISYYNWMVLVPVLLYLLVEIVLAIVHKGYTAPNQICLFVVYFIQFINLVAMAACVWYMKWKGYHFEAVHGRFAKSPLYDRLKRIMVVYAVCAFQFQLAAMIMRFSSYSNEVIFSFMGVSMIVYNATGLILALIIGVSLSCIVHALWYCLPADLQTYFGRQRVHVQGSDDLVIGLHDTVPGGSELLLMLHTPIEIQPPMEQPVFVFTDIQSSSALWAIGNGELMQEATEIHDDLMRSLLSKYQGYEIATCGDAFQLAFHSVIDAVNYCLQAQLALVDAPWPRQLHNVLPATVKQRHHFRTIFSGLRVRMGIHQANEECDGRLVCDRHALTGKLMYTGASVLIANEIAELGAGGQILVTKRVAEALDVLEDPSQLDCEYLLEFLDRITIPQVHTTIDVFQLLPWPLRRRKRVFGSGLKHGVSTLMNDRTSSNSNPSSWKGDCVSEPTGPTGPYTTL